MKIVAAAWGTGKIYQIDPADGSTVNSWSVSSTPNELFVLGTKIYWAGGSNVGYVDTASSDTFTAAPGGSDNLAVFPDGTIVTAVNNRNVKIVAPDGTITTVNNAAFGIDGASVTVLGDNFFALFNGGEIAKIGKDGSILATGTIGESAAGGVSATDGTNVYFGGNNQIHIYDSDLSTVTTWAFGSAQAIQFYANGQALVNDTDSNLLRIVGSDGSSLDSVAMTNTAGTQMFRADTDNQSAYAALGNQQIDKLDSDLNVIWTRDVSTDTVQAIAAERITGPTTPEELFQASYADASAADPKATALIQPADVQRSIDTDVANLKDGPNLYTVEVIFDIGELSNLNPYNSTTEKARVFFVKDDQPGLREGKNLLLKSYRIRDADPSVPVTCTFWG